MAELRPEVSSPRCPTTPHGLPVRLLVDPPPRRRWPRVVVVAVLAFGAVPAWNGVQGRVRRARAPAATVNRVIQLEAAAPAGRPAEAVRAQLEVVAPSGERVRLPAFATHGRIVARVRPREPGLHRWRLLDGAGPDAAELGAGSFRAQDAPVGLPPDVERDERPR
jgi:hypothetical protein